MSNTTFEQALAAARQANNKVNDKFVSIAVSRTLRAESVNKLSSLILQIVELLGFDEEVYESKIKHSRKSQYGRVPELISIIASMYAWPVESVDKAKEIDDLQGDILEELESAGIIVDDELLFDIKESKGYHTFMSTDTAEVIYGVEPDYEAFNYSCGKFAELMGLDFIDYKIDADKWHRAENKNVDKAELEMKAIQKEFDRLKEFNEAQ